MQLITNGPLTALSAILEVGPTLSLRSCGSRGTAYFEVLGISDIGQLTRGNGVLPSDDQELIVGCIKMDFEIGREAGNKTGFEEFWALTYEFSPPCRSANLLLPHISFYPTMSADGTIRDVTTIPAIYSDFNRLHALIRRQDRETFVIKDPLSDPPNAESVLTAKTLQLFIRHNLLMNDPEQTITHNPFGYRKFAEIMNDFDHSTMKWAYYIPEDQWTQWYVEGEVATLTAFLVRDQDIESGIPPGKMLVDIDRYERATEALWQREQGRARSIAKSKQEKQGCELQVYRDVTSAGKRAALAERAKTMESEYRARVGSSRSVSSTPRAPSLTPTIPDDPMITTGG
ncbi:hypothetical protein B0H11DRAFT_1983134 [Mycena galericulata]|nr:hypothetical protein B0H11DRAFT_1983134 [Mycena galericulata]